MRKLAIALGSVLGLASSVLAQRDAGVAGDAAATVEVTPLSWGDAERRDWVFQAPGRGDVRSIAWSGDGSRLAVATSPGFVSVIDPLTGEVFATHRIFSTSYMEAFRVALDEHGTHAFGFGLGGDSSRHTFSWDVAEDRVTAHDRYLSDEIELSPDGARGVLLSDGQLCTYRIASGQSLRCVPRGTLRWAGWPTSRALVALDPAVGDASTLRVLNPGLLTERFRVDGARAWDLDARGRTLVVLLADAVVFYSGTTGAEQRRLPVPAGATDVSLSRDGTRVAIGSESTSVLTVVGAPRRGTAPEVSVPGQVVRLASDHALVREVGGEVRRYRLPSGARGERVRLPGGELFWSSQGAVAAFEGERIEIVGVDGRRHMFSTAGEHSVWAATLSAAGGALELDGRFGVDLWTSAGAVATECERGAFFEGERLVDRRRECTAAGATLPYTQRLGGSEVSPRGVVTDAEGARVRLSGVDRVCGSTDSDDGGGGYVACNRDVRLAAGGAIVVHERGGFLDGSPAEPPRLYDAHTGRRLASLSFGEITVDPAGRWAAVSSWSHLQIVRLPEGTTTLEVGDPSDDPWDRTPLTVSPDASRIVRWSGPAEHYVADVVDPLTGATVRTLPFARMPRFALSGDGMVLAYVDHGALHVLDLAGSASADTAGVTGEADGLMCSGGRAFALDARAHALVRRELGACDLPGGVLTGGGRFITARDEGVVRVRRTDGAELWLRSLRGEHVVHFAHDAAGRWWSDATGEPPMHARSGHDGQLHPLEPAMRDAELLRRFFTSP